MIRKSASFIMGEFSSIIIDTIDHFEKEGLIRSPDYKEALRFESTVLLYWIFQKTSIFDKLWLKLLLDEMHDQFYSTLKKNGFNREALQRVSNDFNERYKTYNDSFGKDTDGLSRVGVKFIRFLTDCAKVELKKEDLLIPIYLIQKVTPKFEEFKTVMEN